MSLPEQNQKPYMTELATEAPQATPDPELEKIVNTVVADEQMFKPKAVQPVILSAEQPYKRPKKKLSEKQLAHLTRIRKLAAEKKRANRLEKQRQTRLANEQKQKQPDHPPAKQPKVDVTPATKQKVNDDIKFEQFFNYMDRYDKIKAYQSRLAAYKKDQEAKATKEVPNPVMKPRFKNPSDGWINY